MFDIGELLVVVLQVVLWYRCGSGGGVRDDAVDWSSRAPPPGPTGEQGSLEQLEHRLRGLVGLREHGGAGLGEDLALGEVDHLGRHVDVADAALGRRQVLDGDVEVVDRVLEPVLVGTELGADGGDVLERGVERADRGDGVGRAREVRRAGREAGRVEPGDRQAGQHTAGGDVHLDDRARRRARVDLEGAVERAVQQPVAVERRGAGDAVELLVELLELGVGGGLRGGVLRTAVGGLHREVTHALEDGLRLVERAFSGLDDADAVLGVAHGDLRPPICERRPSEMARPAASSAARLIR